eukprot:gene9620-1824_t
MKRKRNHTVEINVKAIKDYDKLSKTPGLSKLKKKLPIFHLEIYKNKQDKALKFLEEENFEIIKSSMDKNILDTVTPLHFLPYEEQIALKESEMKSVLSMIDPENKIEWNGVLKSPVINNYRNNCEFTCGENSKNEIQVGFLTGAFVDGFKTVQSPKDCTHISENSKILSEEMTEFIQKSTFPVYKKENKMGFWRLVKCRENLKNEILLMIQMTTDKEKIEKMKPELIEFFQKKSKLNVVSIYLQFYDGVSNAAPEDSPLEKIFGTDTLQETVCGLNFNISPVSFFQVNTKGAELLYSTIKSWTSTEDVLLDVCCGTGTIGMIMSDSVKKVIGIEMSESSVKDAHENVKLNKIENMELLCGKAEDVLGDTIRKKGLDVLKVTAIVDPPRSGLHPKVSKALVKCKSIKSFIFVSCKPEVVADNYKILSQGFKPVKAIAVDMFPHTSHCELVVKFERK